VNYTTDIDGPSLAGRFPNAPTAQERPSADLKTFVTDCKGHGYAIDETKARSELGYTPACDFPQGFVETLNWYFEREDWWLPLLKRR
jgi:dTDP-glucose 4,6-dehydratase